MSSLTTAKCDVKRELNVRCRDAALAVAKQLDCTEERLQIKTENVTIYDLALFIFYNVFLQFCNYILLVFFSDFVILKYHQNRSQKVRN